MPRLDFTAVSKVLPHRRVDKIRRSSKVSLDYGEKSRKPGDGRLVTVI